MCIRIFIRSSQTGLKNIKEALDQNKWQDISEAAHKMAAPCKHLMANDLYDKIKLLERNTAKRMSLENIPDLISTIEKKVKSINQSLAEILETDKIGS